MMMMVVATTTTMGIVLILLFFCSMQKLMLSFPRGIGPGCDGAMFLNHIDGDCVGH